MIVSVTDLLEAGLDLLDVTDRLDLFERNIEEEMGLYDWMSHDLRPVHARHGSHDLQ